MPDGMAIKGAQGKFPFDKQFAIDIRGTTSVQDVREGQRGLFGAPWMRQPILARLDEMTQEEIAAQHEVIPPGVLARHGTGGFSPVQIPDLIGAQHRRYLDRTGLQRNRGIADLMRYAALNQGGDFVSAFGGFVPAGTNDFHGLPDPSNMERYSDEQLYALALYVYWLKPPKNPNLPKTAAQKALVQRGEAIFMDSDNGCYKCHDPKQGYTNNKLTPARGFNVPDHHPEGTNIMSKSVGTDPTLTLTTRRGTGFYKVPSLLGVWYRGPFEHNGSCATLEDCAR